MFIGHLPAGYIWTSLLFKFKVFKNIPLKNKRSAFLAGLIGSIIPDIDILYFYLIDLRQHTHHSYWTHIPFFWLIVFSLLLLYCEIQKDNNIRVVSIVFITNVFIHLILDTIAGGIYWFSPFCKNMIVWCNVPVKSSTWIFNFLFYWTITIEGALVLIATLMYKNKHFPKGMRR